MADRSKPAAGPPCKERSMYDTILFDFDGTVFDTVEGITKSVQYALRKFGIEEETEKLRGFAGPPLGDMFQETFGFSPEQAGQAIVWFRERYAPVGLYESRPFPGMRELLLRLRAAGKKTGIATIKYQPMAEKLLERSGMAGLFDAVCGSPAERSLTKKELALQAMERLGGVKERTVLVGDTKYDARGARESGLAFIGAGYGYAAPGELQAEGAKVVAGSVEELGELLLGRRGS